MRICVYCGSNHGLNGSYRLAAESLGRLLAERGIGIVYGGGSVGLMGVLADAAREADGEVIGVIPQTLFEREVGHESLDDLRIVNSMHERKAMMASLSDAFVAMPGGIGTLEELFEAWTWGQLGVHAKPCALLNIDGFFDELIAFLDKIRDESFLMPIHRGMLIVENDPVKLLDAFDAYEHPITEKWLSEENI